MLYIVNQIQDHILNILILYMLNMYINYKCIYVSHNLYYNINIMYEYEYFSCSLLFQKPYG